MKVFCNYCLLMVEESELDENGHCPERQKETANEAD
jgi:hypothetical protein